jgi:hypothetical protein
MLHKETVGSDTLELLTKLMHDPLLSDFFLVGGTALSLQIGHRRSIDLDLFTIKDFDENALLGEVEEKYNFYTDFQSRNTLKGQIDGVKVDFISHKYPLNNPLLVIENVRMAGIQDIAAMKLNAIAGNGTRLKDFIDIAYMSSFITPVQMVDAYQDKYSARNPVMVIKSMVYHNDVDFNEPIDMMDNNFLWSVIDRRLHDMLDTPEQLFGPINMNVQSRRRGR